MKTQEQSRAEYAHRSEVLELGLRRDAWQSIASALDRDGQITLAKGIYDFLESKEAN